MVHIEKEDNAEIIFLVKMRNDSESIPILPDLNIYNDMKVTIPLETVS